MIKLPPDFIARIQQQRNDANELLEALDTASPVSVRLNPWKKIEQFQNDEPISWCNNGRYLTSRPSFTKDPLFHAGTYYPQEAGSMFIDAILKQLELPTDCIAVDLCAAPGGKSTILLDNLTDSSLLISNEIVRNRAFILRDNLTRWGRANILITSRNTSDFGQIKGLFDLALIDAPCSGEGMFRKDLNARTEWSLKNAETCALRQTEILNDIWPSIKEGGILIYSTCTFNPAENQDQIERVLNEFDCELVSLQFPPSFKLERVEHSTFGTLGFSCMPHQMLTEGFFFSVLRKTERTKSFQIKFKKEQKKNKSTAIGLPGFKAPENHELQLINDAYYLLPSSQSQLMLYIQKQLSCMKLGVRMGELVGSKWNPHFEYALSVFDKTQSSIFTISDLSLENAQSYLKGNPIEIEGKDGWHLVQYQNQALGWLKKIGNRSNNYYPKELRIKMEI